MCTQRGASIKGGLHAHKVVGEENLLLKSGVIGKSGIYQGVLLHLWQNSTVGLGHVRANQPTIG